MRPRSVPELRQAAVDAGWSGEPLAEEILAKLGELESRQPTNEKAQAQPTTNPVQLGLMIAFAAVAIVSVGFAWVSAQSVATVKSELAAQLVAKDKEIESLRASNAAQLATVAEKLAGIIPEAQAAARDSAYAARTTQSTAETALSRLQAVSEELRKAAEGKAATDVTKKP